MTDTTIERGTTNVFADLGLADPAERQTKTRLALALNRIIKDQGLKQIDAARLLGVPQPPSTGSGRAEFRRWSITGSMAFRPRS